jgi:polysaccharide pyruvyl transferase WcaK-like protein
MHTSQSPAKALVLHAYSARNDGDGFLVAAAVRLLEAAGVAPTNVEVAAVDPSSFGDLKTISLPFSRRRSIASNTYAAVETLAGAALRGVGIRSDMLAAAIDAADVVIGVGGGYLRAGSIGEQLRTGLVHYPQLALAAGHGSKTIYLPQSVGPLTPPLGAMIRSQLSRLGAVYVRDDRTVSELVGLANVRRVPDMAALELGRRRIGSDRPQPRRIVLVARDLPSRRATYLPRLQHLASLIPDATIAIQSDVSGNDDRAFCARLFPDRHIIPAHEAFTGPPSVVISVRLHGALMAILAGHPAIHLSYERKGWGAYADLGLNPYVHNAGHFNPAAVAAQAKDLMNEPQSFWAGVAAKAPFLEREYAALVQSVRELITRQEQCA